MNAQLDVRPALTEDEILALRMVRNGADVYAHGLAVALRSIQKKAPELVDIVRAMSPPSGEKQQPHFGAITTAKGKAFLRKLGVSRHD